VFTSIGRLQNKWLLYVTTGFKETDRRAPSNDGDRMITVQQNAAHLLDNTQKPAAGWFTSGRNYTEDLGRVIRMGVREQYIYFKTDPDKRIRTEKGRLANSATWKEFQGGEGQEKALHRG